MKELKEKRGITLIALVITIIVLLILAGVTIATLTGDNGLLQKATNSKGETIKAEGLERLKLAVVASYDNNGKVDTQNLAKNLSEIDGLKYINNENQEVNVLENTEIQLTAKFKLNGYSYKISDEGKVTYKKEGAIENEDIMKSPSTYYGKYVTNYNSLSDAGINAPEGQKWQIFLADDTNIYLISSNYIASSYSDLDYDFNSRAKFTDTVLNFYDQTIEGNPSIESILNKLDKKSIYHMWLNNNKNINYYNTKAVLSMLDVEKWENYMDIEKKFAKYTIGGPTIEMFCNSYNFTHNGDDIFPSLRANNSSSDYSYGYKIKKGTGNDGLAAGGLKEEIQLIPYTEHINDMQFKCYYYLSSPSANRTDIIYYVSPKGHVGNDSWPNASVNFRPLVCLKSNVHLVEKTNGTTTTYELELD